MPHMTRMGNRSLRAFGNMKSSIPHVTADFVGMNSAEAVYTLAGSSTLYAGVISGGWLANWVIADGDLAHGNGIYILTWTDNTVSTFPHYQQYATSTDGVNWVLRTMNVSSANGTGGHLAFHGGVFVYHSQGGEIFTTTDGITWSYVTTLGTIPLLTEYTAGKFLTFYEDATPYYVYFASSSSGSSWSSSTISTDGNGGSTFSVKTAAVGSTVVAVYMYQHSTGKTSHFVSTDSGATWTLTPIDLLHIFLSIINFGGIFVASGVYYDSGTGLYGVFTATSTNGTTWTYNNPSSNTGESAGSLFIKSGKVCFYSDQNYWESSDGTTWTQTSMAGFSNSLLLKVVA